MVVKGFMGSNVVVGVAKVIEHALLGVEVGGGWFGGPGSIKTATSARSTATTQPMPSRSDENS